MAPEIPPEVPVMLPLSTDADTASLWWAYVDRYVTRRSGAEAALVAVIEADPGLAVARAAALLMIGLDAADFDPAETAAAARRGRADHDWERSFTEATLTTHSQGMWPAAPRLGAPPAPLPGRPDRPEHHGLPDPDLDRARRRGPGPGHRADRGRGGSGSTRSWWASRR